MRYYEVATIKTHVYADGICTMSLKAPGIARNAAPGQFVMVYLDNEAHLLPRPISLFDVDKTNGVITLVYAIVGVGTKIMSEWPVGHMFKMLGALGTGFDIENSGKKAALIGGGIGTPPLFFLAKELNHKGVETDVYMGFRQTPPGFAQCFDTLSNNITIVTEDGSCKNKGYVTSFLPSNPAYDIIYTCGPIPMLMAVAEYAHFHNIPCQVSVEERMACGLGACKGCVVKTRSGYQLCCAEGPVFDSKEVIWNA